jgi:hypothetical protein
MMIIGWDLHTRYQQIAMVDRDTGEMLESRLEHASGRGTDVLCRAARAGTSGDRSHGIQAWVGGAASRVGARVVDGGRGGTSFHRGILPASVGRMSTSNSKDNRNPKTFHERKSQNHSQVHLSLDNADTVIEGGPLNPRDPFLINVCAGKNSCPQKRYNYGSRFNLLCNPLILRLSSRWLSPRFRLYDGVVHVEHLPAATVLAADHHAAAHDVHAGRLDLIVVTMPDGISHHLHVARG